MLYKLKNKVGIISLLITIMFMVASESVSAAYYAMERGLGTNSVGMSLGNVASGLNQVSTEHFNYKYILERNSVPAESDFQLDVDKAAYCLNMDAQTPGYKMEITKITKYTAQQRKVINAIIRNSSDIITSVPDSFITDDTAVGFNTDRTKTQIRLGDYQYYCTQIAINVYLTQKTFGEGPGRIRLYPWENQQTINDINNLINEAKQRVAKETESFSVSTNMNSLIVSVDNDSIDDGYFVSELFEVTENATDYEVKVESFDGKNNHDKIKVVDASGKEKDSFSTGEKFKVMIPVEEVVAGESGFKVTINATQKYTEYKDAVIYTTGNSAYQDLVESGEIEEKEKTDSTFFVIQIKKDTFVEVSKLDVTGKKALEGATLQVLDKDKKEMSCTIVDEKGKEKTLEDCSWVSGKEPVSIKNLSAGKYYLIETQAPEGYTLSKEEIEFEVNETSYIVPVEMLNELEVEVPDTLSSKSALLLSIAMFDIALGIGIVIYVKKNKVQE